MHPFVGTNFCHSDKDSSWRDLPLKLVLGLCHCDLLSSVLQPWRNPCSLQLHLNWHMSLLYPSESDSTECDLEEIMDTVVCELRSCFSHHDISTTDLMYMRIFYVKDTMYHWHVEEFIHSYRDLEGTTFPAPAFSLIPVDGLNKENTIMMFCCFLQKPEKGKQEWLTSGFLILWPQ